MEYFGIKKEVAAATPYVLLIGFLVFLSDKVNSNASKGSNKDYPGNRDHRVNISSSRYISSRNWCR